MSFSATRAWSWRGPRCRRANTSSAASPASISAPILRADTPLLSGQHARLTINYDHLLLEDLGSSDGTFVNEQLLAAATRVFPSQAIRLGAVRLALHRQRMPSDPGVSLAPAQAVIQRFVPDELLAEKRYAIGGIVAEGGMGVILDARQSAMQRTVAMKVMLDGSAEASVLRFIEEAQVTGQLEHPNIIPVHELGVDEQDQLYYTMKFVRGVTLKKVLELLAAGDAGTVEKYPLSALLTIFQKVSDAIAFAHSKGVIHRDIKPDNIMLGDFGEVLVLDWGLAKVMAKRPAPAPASDVARSAIRSARVTGAPKAGQVAIFPTMPESIVGTPQYMAPEQARGEAEILDQRADIYALGGLLYYVLTLRPSVTGASVDAILDKVRAGQITPPEQILTRPRRPRLKKTPPKATSQIPPAAPVDGSTMEDSRPSQRSSGPLPEEPSPAAIALVHLQGERVPESLSAVCMKALALDPTARYQRVEDLQTDVLAYQNGFATGAESASGWRQFTLLLKRHKAVSTAIAASLLLLAVLTALYTTRVVQERTIAATQRDRAETSSREAEDRLYFSHMLLAGRDLAEGRPGNARAMLDRHRREPSGRDLREWEWYFLYGQLSQETLRVQAHRGTAYAVAVAPDGMRAATVGDDGEVAVWDTRGLRELARWRAHDTAAASVAWNRDGTHLATASVAGEVRVWDIVKRTVAAQMTVPARTLVRALAWEPVSGPVARLAIGARNSTVLLWRPLTTAVEAPVESPADARGNVNSLHWSSDGRQLAVGLSEKNPAVVVLEVAENKAGFTAETDVYAVAFDPRSSTLAMGNKHLRVALYDVRTKTTLVSRTLHQSSVSALAWRPDGGMLASASYDGTIRLQHRDKLDAEPDVLSGHEGKVHSVAWATVPAVQKGVPVSDALFSTGSDGTLRAWVAERLAGQSFSAATTSWLKQARWRPDGAAVGVATLGQSWFFVEPAGAVTPRRSPGSTIQDLAWAPDGKRMAFSSRTSAQVRVVEADTDKVIATFAQPGAWRLAWHPDGRHVACGSASDTRVFDTADSTTIATIPRAASRCAWHPDGRRLAIGTSAGAVEI